MKRKKGATPNLKVSPRQRHGFNRLHLEALVE
jgi:hypothetical protein